MLASSQGESYLISALEKQERMGVTPKDTKVLRSYLSTYYYANLNAESRIQSSFMPLLKQSYKERLHPHGREPETWHQQAPPGPAVC